jgi:hypothetical protein
VACSRLIFTFTFRVVTTCCGLLDETRRFGVVCCHIFGVLYKATRYTELLALTYSTTTLKITTNSFFRSELNGVFLGPGKIRSSERRDESLSRFLRYLFGKSRDDVDLTVSIEAEFFSKILLPRYQTTRCQNPQVHNTILYLREVWTVHDHLSCVYIHLFALVRLTRNFFRRIFKSNFLFIFV